MLSIQSTSNHVFLYSLAFAALTSRDVQIETDQHRPGSNGLSVSGLALTKAFLKLTAAESEGVSLGSKCIKLFPGVIQSGSYTIHLGNGNSISEFLVVALLGCCFASDTTHLKVTGASDRAGSISIDYFEKVLLPFYKQFADFKWRLVTRDFEPGGRAKLDLVIKPKHKITHEEFYSKGSQTVLTPLDLSKKGKIDSICGVSVASKDLSERFVAERQITGVRQAFADQGYQVKIKKEYVQTSATGTAVTLWVRSREEGELLPVTIGSYSYGERSKRAEFVGADAAEDLMDEFESGGVVDSELSKHLLPVLSLTGGRFLAAEVGKSHNLVIELIKIFGLPEVGVKTEGDSELLISL